MGFQDFAGPYYNPNQGSKWNDDGVTISPKNDRDVQVPNLQVTGDASVLGTITENNANVYTVLTTGIRSVYLDGATGNDLNTGRFGEPVKTLQKALNIAGFQASSEETQIVISAGTYEVAAVPFYALGKITLLGSNLADPTQVKIDGTTFGNTCLQHVDNAAFLSVEGIQFNNQSRAITTRNTRLEIVGCLFSDVFWAVDDSGGSYITIPTTVNYATTVNLRSGTSFTAFNIGRGTYFDVGANLVITGADRMFTLRDSRMIITGDLTLTHRGSTSAAITFFCIGFNELRFQGSIVADGNDATPTNGSAFLYQSTGYTRTFFLGGETFTLDDFQYRVLTADQATIEMGDDSTINWTETNVTNIFKATIGSIGYSATSTFAEDGEWIGNRFDSYISLEKCTAVKTTNYQVTVQDRVIPFDTTSGNLTVTLEAAPETQRRLTIVHKTPTNRLTIDGNGNNIIDDFGPTATKFSTTYVSIQLLFDGTDWLVI